MNNENVLLFSRNFKEGKFKKIINAGYKVTKAKIEYIVYWYDMEEDKEYKILIPGLTFEKIKG